METLIITVGKTFDNNSITLHDIINKHTSRCADLFDGLESSSTSRDIIRITNDLLPGLVRWRLAQRPQQEESEVAVRHVVVLGAEQKPGGDRELRMAVNDHCRATYI